MAFAELLLRRELVVRAASKPDPIGGRLTSVGVEIDVIKFEERSRFAAVPVDADVRALTVVAYVHFALHPSPDVP